MDLLSGDQNGFCPSSVPVRILGSEFVHASQPKLPVVFKSHHLFSCQERSQDYECRFPAKRSAVKAVVWGVDGLKR